ncbi:hypothetical protein, partial [Alistipes sp. ZOR0009]|uniref:hypothetical protein n=1 Tax=Alistipes sp. ZOR0009 TaxID=1339253 RepID=UPI003977B66D
MQNKGTLIASEIKSFNTEDDFPYADTSKLKGGHMQVDTIAERDAISMLRRRELMRVSVAENLVTYVLKKDENGELKKWEEADFPIQVKDLSLSTAATLTEGTVAYYAIGKEYFKQIFRYFIVRTIVGRKKFLPIGLTYIIANEGGICIFDPDTEQYILQKTWESLQAPSTYIHPNTHPASIIDQNELFRFVSDSQIEYWNKKANVDDLNKIISDLVGSAPGSLDTLKELAAALGDDPNFATTIINKLAEKANTDHDHAWESIGNRPSKLSQFANDLGNFGSFLTGINEAMIAAALGYTPYSASNPANFASIEFVKQKISELVSSSPEALDTLKEL